CHFLTTVSSFLLALTSRWTSCRPRTRPWLTRRYPADVFSRDLPDSLRASPSLPSAPCRNRVVSLRSLSWTVTLLPSHLTNSASATREARCSATSLPREAPSTVLMRERPTISADTMRPLSSQTTFDTPGPPAATLV